jgi:predicted GNAT family N-acyltransferase
MVVYAIAKRCDVHCDNMYMYMYLHVCRAFIFVQSCANAVYDAADHATACTHLPSLTDNKVLLLWVLSRRSFLLNAFERTRIVGLDQLIRLNGRCKILQLGRYMPDKLRDCE